MFLHLENGYKQTPVQNFASQNRLANLLANLGAPGPWLLFTFYLICLSPLMLLFLA